MHNQNQGLVWDTPNQQPTQAQSQPGQQAQSGQSGLVWDDNKGQTAPPSDEIQSAAPDADFATKAAHAVAGTFEGIGEGAFGGAAGITDLLGGKGTGISEAFHKLAGDEDQQHGTAQNIGRGIETIGEFILGDAALKGLSFADKLKQVSGVMKFIEKSPRLARALQLGINVGKAGAELSPEERAVLKQYPTLARLAGLGLDSIRAGVVQGGQTLAHGGTVGQAVKEGAGMAAGSAVLGAPLATLGGVVSKGAEAAKTAEGLRSVAEQAPTSEELGQQLEQSVRGAVQPKIDAATKALEDANEKKAGIASVAQGMAENAPTQEALTSAAQKAAKDAHTALGTAYEDAANDIKNELQGVTKDVNGSRLQQTAKDILQEVEDRKDNVKDILKIPNPISDNLKRIATRLADTKIGLDENNQPIQHTADDLLDYAKQLKENIRKTGWATAEERADRDAYFRLLDAVHGDFQDLANKSNKPELMQAVDKMNSDYKEGIAQFNNPDVKKILQGNSESNIMKIVQGTGSVKDIKAIKKAIGKDAYGQLVDASIQRLAANSVNPATGEFDFEKFFKSMNNISPEVRGEMFEGTKKAGAMELAMSQMRNLNASEVIPNSETTIKEAQKFMEDLLGNGNVDRLIGNPDRVQALNTLVGPEAMGELGKSVIQNQLRQAATDVSGKVGPVDFDKVLKFFSKFKDQPELVETLFRPTQETAEAYDKVLNDSKYVDSAKKLVKMGLIAPAGLGLGAAVGHLFSSPLLGALLAYGGERYHGGQVLEYIADHPATWRTLRSLDEVAKKPVAQGVNMLGRYAAGKAAGTALNTVLSGAQTSLANK